MNARRVQIYVGDQLILSAENLQYNEKKIRLTGVSFLGKVGKTILQMPGKEVAVVNAADGSNLKIDLNFF